MNIGKKKSNKNFGQRIEEVVKFQERTKINAKRSEEDFIDISFKFGKQIAAKLDKYLNDITNSNKDYFDIADDIYKILLETNLDKLEKARQDYEFWQDWNNKFNS